VADFWLVLLTLLVPLVPMFLFPGCTCCGVECLIFNDEFASDQLAANWTVQSGTWAVAGGRLATQDDNALILANAAMPGGSIAAKVSGWVISHGSVVAFHDGSSYWYAELEPGVTNGTFKLFSSGGGQQGTTQTVSGFTAGGGLLVELCYADGVVTALAINPSGPLVMAKVCVLSTVTVENTKGGFKASTTDVEFDNFKIQRHGFQYEDCESCVGLCQVVADGWKVVISGVGGACSGANGTVLTGVTSTCVSTGSNAFANVTVTTVPGAVNVLVDSGLGGNALFVYEFTEAENCDATTITDQAMPRIEFNSGGCNFSATAVVLSAR
jgi:hypothetical protein